MCAVREKITIPVLLLLLALGGCASSELFEAEFRRFKEADVVAGWPEDEDMANAEKATEFFLEEAGTKGVKFLFAKLDGSDGDKLYALEMLRYYVSTPHRYSAPPFEIENSYKVRDKEKCAELVRKGLQANKHILYPDSPEDDTGLITCWVRKHFVELVSVAQAVELTDDILKVMNNDPSLDVRAQVEWFLEECFEKLPEELKKKTLDSVFKLFLSEPDAEQASKTTHFCVHEAGLSAVPYFVRTLLDPKLPQDRIGRILTIIMYEARGSKDRSWLQVLVFVMSEIEPAAIAAITQMEKLVLEEDRQNILAATAAPPDRVSASWMMWWQANGRYLYYDAWKEKFSISKDAKKNGSPVDSATGEPLRDKELKKTELKENELSSVLKKALSKGEGWHEKDKDK